jgi:hypothetical protein
VYTRTRTIGSSTPTLGPHDAGSTNTHPTKPGLDLPSRDVCRIPGEPVILAQRAFGSDSEVDSRFGVCAVR